MHVPVVTRCTFGPGLNTIVQTESVSEVKVTGNPEEDDAEIGKSESPIVLPESVLKVIDWLACPTVKLCETCGAEL